MKTEFARQQMVEQQVRAWDVLNPRILEVLKTVPREQFVPAGFEALAFADTEIPIGHGQMMMTPTLEGRVLQALQPDAADHVLEIGTGTGFLSACIARLANRVTSVDIVEQFLKTATANLEDSGISNVKLLTMDAMQHLPDEQFDAIAITGSIQKFDARFAAALKPGGRLFVVVGDAPAMEARLITRTGDNDWHTESLFETELLPLVNGSEPPQFLF
ncbi:MAG: protein-L-isoaspartate O-methyltransferase [Gammaproteobacteria bacterium]|nr:protein-L-isoaspartate O-methyltransferase [Gammaproteobacteria bacterium]MDH3428699.1 protein-L-isoaspartate O-methyltransferase [Gammaproteobacteria bacterium]